MTMRVVHVVPAPFGASGIVGGAERYAFELARRMAAIVPTTLVSFGDVGRQETVGALRVKVLGNARYVRQQRTNPFSLGVFETLRDADVVHCHQQHVLVSSVVAAWSRMTGRRVFVSDLGGGGWDISSYVSTDSWYHGHLHISQYSRHIYGHDRQRRAHVIGGGVDTERFAPDADVRRDGGALFVGRLLPHKGVIDVIRGLPRQIPLTVVGPPPDSEMKAQLLTAADGKPVTFKHGLDDDALVHEYRRAMCVVLPSVYRTPDGRETKVPELLGQTLLEGMACEAPALCTSVASMPEVVEHGVSGFVVPPNDPTALADRLSWFHAHPEAARTMGLAARQRVLDRFTWDVVVQRCLALYADPSSRFSMDFAESGDKVVVR